MRNLGYYRPYRIVSTSSGCYPYSPRPAGPCPPKAGFCPLSLSGQKGIALRRRISPGLPSLFFIGIESPEFAISRIKSRIEKGGHGVPDEEVRRRYKESLSNLMRILPICDNVQIYDNTKSFRKIAQFQGGMICWQTEDLPAWYCSNAGQKHDANRRKRRDRHDPSFKVEAGEVSRNRSLHHSVLT